MNEIAKVHPKRARGPRRPKPKAAGMSWVDRFAGTLDEDFARGALDQPAPVPREQSDISFG